MPELEKFVQKEVEGGLYQAASEVARAGLRRLKVDQEVRLTRAPATMERQLTQSVERLDSGNGVDGEEVFRRLRKRIKQTRAHA